MYKLKVFCFFLLLASYSLFAVDMRGYYDAPYKRYEADSASLGNAAVITTKSYNQTELQSEASNQVCVNLNAPASSVEWTIDEAADGLVIRYALDLKLPAEGTNHETVITGKLGVYVDGVKQATLDLTTHWSWEDLRNNGYDGSQYIQNLNWRKRFDEVRLKLDAKIPVGGKLKLVQEEGDIFIDFAELEPIEPFVPAPVGAAIYSGDGSDLQFFINQNGGGVIYLPPGLYTVGEQLDFDKVDNTKLQGAGIWYTQINFNADGGGLWSRRANTSYADLYLTTDKNSRENSYQAIKGAYNNGATIERVWTEHFVVGAWLAQYGAGVPFSDGLLISHCRFRNGFADGVNLCKGSRNCIIEHCSFRNNGDDDMAVWPADGIDCVNNTFRYCTSENVWRASGAALYGGKENKYHHLLIKDPIDVGVRVNNVFPGIEFNAEDMHEFYDITIVSGGTMNDVFNNKNGAIDIYNSTVSGDRISNIRMSNIDIVDAKNDAIYMSNQSSAYGLVNFSFNNISIDGTGKEYPYNNAKNSTSGRGYFVSIVGNPHGDASYCNLNMQNRGGSATADILNVNSNFSWTENTNCASNVNATGISVNPVERNIFTNETYTLSAEVLPISASNKNYTWSSNNLSVATVSETGVVKAISEGTATITATSEDGGFIAQSLITVTNSPVLENNGDGNPLSNVTGVPTYLFDKNQRRFRVEDSHTDFEVNEVFTFAFDADENLQGLYPIAGYNGLLDWLDSDPTYNYLGVHLWFGTVAGADIFLQRIPNSTVFVTDVCLANLFGADLPASALELGNSFTFFFRIFAKSNIADGADADVHWKIVQPQRTLSSTAYTATKSTSCNNFTYGVADDVCFEHNDITAVRSQSTNAISINSYNNIIEIKGAKGEEMLIFDLLGRLIYSSHINTETININYLEKGFYLVKVCNTVKKILIK